MSNESDYASTFLDHRNEYLGAFASGDVLSDNPYGTVNPTPFLDRYLYLPTLSVGRLVESADDISNAVTQFISSNGTLAPSTAVVTGYDFLADGSQQVASTETAQHGPANVKSLIDDPTSGSTAPPWSAAALNTLLGAAPAKVLSLNAHYDHYRLLPSDRGALFSAAQMATKSLTGRFVFTMGCHAGLSVSDAILVGASDPRRPTGRRSTAGRRPFAGNTGFGYGDTTGIAYSEKLMSLLAKRLDGSMTAGDALTFAKNDFKASLGPIDVYDEKVLSEATYYGLPMYKVGAAVALPPPPASRPTTPEPSIGGSIVSASLNVTPTLTPKTSPYGSYFVSDDTASVSYRPVEPATSTDVTEPNLVAHGALVTQLASTDIPNFDAAFSMPTIDRTALAPEPVFADAVFPTKLQTVQTYADPRGQRQRLVLVVGQFASDPTAAAGRGRQRNFTSVGARVYYAPSGQTDFTPAQFGLIEGSQVGQQAAFSAHVTDDNANGVKRVLVGYHDGNTWKFVDLQPSSSDPTLWTGGGPSATANPEFFVQAVDGAGNVSVTSYKGRYYLTPPAPANGGSVSWALTGPQGQGGWFTGSVSVAITAPAGATIDLDGGPANLASPVTVSGDGLHLVGVHVGTDVTRIPVPIDATAPTIAITPADGSNPVFNDGTKLRFSCADGGSGIVSCTAKLNGAPVTDGTDISTTTGPKTVVVTAKDAAGNTSTKTVTFEVHWDFDGFLLPVKNPPILNTVVAGNIIPVRFKLGGNQGLNIFAPGYPTSAPITCPANATTWKVIETISPQGPSILVYVPLIQQYIFIWKTPSPSAWPVGTCRLLTLKFVDGSVRTALFKARKDD